MTDQAAALSALVNTESDSALLPAQRCLSAFYRQWRHESLVINQWFNIQSTNPKEGGLERVKALMTHPDFDLKNPNKARALIGGFCALNPHNFHKNDGSGYAFLADRVIELNAINPQIASRLINPLSKWKKMDQQRSVMMKQQLQRIADTDQLSADLREVVTKSL